MKTRNLIFILCIVLFAASLMVMVYFYPESFGMTKPHVIVREEDFSKGGKDDYDFFRNHVSSTCEYTPKPPSANSYDPVNCIWQNTVCPFEGNPRYQKFFDNNGESYVGLVDEFGSLITCDNISITMPDSESTFEECDYGFKEIDGVCKELGKIHEKDIPIFFEIQLMELDIEWDLVERSWANPDFEIEPPARICSHIINDGKELYISTIWENEYSLSDMMIQEQMPDDCVKFFPVTEIAKNEN